MNVELNGNSLKLMTGDITKQATEAIVNAANGSLLGGGGVDGAIHRAAGVQLLEECKALRKEKLQGEMLPTGDAVLTKGYDLPAKHVIHTVGPVWEGNAHREEQLLANCYKNTLQLAKEKEITSISFPSISTGIFRFPIKLASEVALGTVVEFLQRYEFGHVVMTLFSDEDYEVYAKTLQGIMNASDKE